MASHSFIYQHAPKCGGRSFIAACSKHLQIVADQPPSYPSKDQVAEYAKNRLDLNQLKQPFLIHGHLVFNGIRPVERYPEEIASGRIKLITIIRDPMERAMSAYFHRKKRGKPWNGTLEEFLATRKNNITGFLGLKMKGDEPTVDPFFFIGLTEQLQRSATIFARLAGLPDLEIQQLNTSPRDPIDLGESTIKQFREQNANDYRLYAYVQKRFEEHATATGA